MILLDERLRFSALHKLKTEGGHDWTERSLRITQVIHWSSQFIEQAQAINLPRMTNRTTVIVRMDRSLQSVMKAVLNYVWVFQLQ